MTPRRLIPTTFVVGLAALAFVVGAGAAARPDDRPGMLGVGAKSSVGGQQNVRPDDRPGFRGPGTVFEEESAKASLRPDNRAGVRAPGNAVAMPTNSLSIDGATFDWSAAAIGASSALVLALLIGGSLLVSTRRLRS